MIDMTEKPVHGQRRGHACRVRLAENGSILVERKEVVIVLS
ncbi:hypothetical protein [Paraburkholderia ultramafica]|nr:hypothetical protein [Paraburkholderia ultramafica]